jgi:hypothetical protein
MHARLGTVSRGLFAVILIAAFARAAGASMAAISLTALGAVSGGGTVTNPTCGDASFGLNSVRPSSFPNGQALGRIDYQRIGDCPNAHVNVPVISKSVTVSTTPTPNGTGGEAALIGDCGAIDTTCPSAPGGRTTTHVLVFTRDTADDGAGMDQFRILFLSCTATPVAPTEFGQIPSGCVESLGAEGGLLTTGNLQVRMP